MPTKSTLNLLVIDEDQRYAERLVELLSLYYPSVNLGFLDDKKELIRMLRQSWDVLVFGHAYDMTFSDVVGIVQEQELDLPMICLMNNDTANTGRNAEGLPKVIAGTMIKALSGDNETQIVIAIKLLHEHVESRRQLASLKHILSEAEQRANILIKNSKSAVAYIDQGIHIFANQPYLDMFGYEDMTHIMGVPVIDLIAGGDNIKSFKQFLRRFDKGNRDQVEFEFESRRTDDTTFEAKLQLAAATFEGAPVTQIIIQQNDNNAAEIAKQLAAAERQDSLTGLLNRRGFEERLEAACRQVHDNKELAAVLYIRLDNIGKINSTMGLQGVDATVKQVGYTLDEFFSDGEVSRFADSTFTVIVYDMNESQLKAQAQSLLERVSGQMIDVGNRTTNTTVSIGMIMLDANAPKPAVVMDRVLDAWNTVMTKTERQGNAVHLYDPSQHVNSDDDALAEYLVSAITHNRFKLFYQPIYDIDTDTSNFYEVYLRLPLSDGTMMTPDKFLSVAKSRNLLEKIDRWVLINACKVLSNVRKQDSNTRLLIQLSSASLADKKLVSVVNQLINAVGGDASALTLRFGEQVIIDHFTLAKAQFDALNKIGCGTGVYNFGTTAKAMEVVSYLKPNMVCLARNYVKDLNKDASNLETVQTLVASVKEHEADVLMPFIEDAATMSVAWSVGARYLQGYYLQEPTETMLVNQG